MPENTAQAFAEALALGATGLETDVWMTKDAVVVLDHDGVVRRGLRNRPLSAVTRADLPEHVLTARHFFAQFDHSPDFSIDLKDPAAGESLVADALSEDINLSRVWLCSPSIDVLRGLRSRHAELRLVHSTRVSRLQQSTEMHCALLAREGIDALNLHHSEWSGGLVTLVHRFGVHAFAWDIQQADAMINILRMGMDAVYSDHADMMATTVQSDLRARGLSGSGDS